jgi:hypothetical protein
VCGKSDANASVRLLLLLLLWDALLLRRPRVALVRVVGGEDLLQLRAGVEYR